MLAERFIASVGVPEKVPPPNVAKDAGIFIHEYQPLNQQRAIFKKSATAPECLAVSETHIFAAQAERSVVHVYNREQGNQEATVPFTERSTCLALACKESVLVLGTAEGRIFLWETFTGRQVATSQAHLQAVTGLVVDPTSNFLLSASADSTIHVWSLPGLLSFASDGSQDLSPLRTFTLHSAEVTALAVGHSSGFSNFAVSTSKDKTCLVWDYHTNNVLRTILLPAVPTCLALDAADRAIYIGYDDGSLQQLNLYTVDAEAGTAPRSLQDNADTIAATDLAARSRWRPADASKGTVRSLSLSFDSCTLISGHQNGSIEAWDVATGRAQATFLQIPLPGPVTNLAFLPVAGLFDDKKRCIKVANIVKPQFGAFDGGRGVVPGNYALKLELAPASQLCEPTMFKKALTASAFPKDLLDLGLAELASSNDAQASTANGHGVEESEDFMALDGDLKGSQQPSLEKQNASLKAQLESLRRLQAASFVKMEKTDAERKSLLQKEQNRLRRRDVNGYAGVSSDDSMSDSD